VKQQLIKYLQCSICRKGSLAGVTPPNSLVTHAARNFQSSMTCRGSSAASTTPTRSACSGISTVRLNSTATSAFRSRATVIIWRPTGLKGETILEAGSGAGRFTEILATTGADILSFDLSSAVEANYANNGHNPNVLIFQGDIINIPVREQSMDKVFCLGVTRLRRPKNIR
jgi:hypothetical protein